LLLGLIALHSYYDTYTHTMQQLFLSTNYTDLYNAHTIDIIE